MYARSLPWQENSVAVVKNAVYPIQIDGNLDARSVRIVNNTDGPIYFRRQSTVVSRGSAEGVIRGGGGVVNFPERMNALALLPDASGTIDVTISGLELPDIFQAQELTRWSDTQVTDETPAGTGGTGTFGTRTYPSSGVYATADFATIDIFSTGSVASANLGWGIDLEWWLKATDSAAWVLDSFDVADPALTNQRFVYTFPVRAPFFRWTVLADNQDSVTLAWLYANRVRTYEHYHDHHGLLPDTVGSVGAGVTVAGGATRTDYLAPYSGPVQFMFRTAAAANEVLIQSLTYLGQVVGTLYDNLNFASNQTISPVLHVPQRIIRVQFTNSDAGGKNYRAMAVPIR